MYGIDKKSRSKKCPCCGSTRTVNSKKWFRCKKCNYIRFKTELEKAKGN